jgi:hypothetical protein
LHVDILSDPPSGIASREFTARLSTAISSWLGSTTTGQSGSQSSNSTCTADPAEISIRSRMPCSSRLTCVRRGCSDWLRANESSWFVSFEPRFAADLARSMTGRTFSSFA